MAVPQPSSEDGIRFLDDDEAHALFDAQAHELVGMSGEEFLRRLDAGEWRDVIDDPRRPELSFLVSLRPLAE
ncbi:MAG TPA: hypothetical protein VFH48_25810 [Chloroflexota bacterium]|nr:hypothetical protein [Chloroflexota bacterium]